MGCFSSARGAAGSPRPQRALCSASFFGSQCGGNGLTGSIGLRFTRPTLKYVLWSRKNRFQCSTLCQKEIQVRNRRQTRRDGSQRCGSSPLPKKSPPKRQWEGGPLCTYIDFAFGEPAQIVHAVLFEAPGSECARRIDTCPNPSSREDIQVSITSTPHAFRRRRKRSQRT